MRCGASRPALGDDRGMTLLEILVAGMIFLVVTLGLSSLYLFTTQSFESVSADAMLQREATLVQEEIARQLRGAVAVHAASSGAVCGGADGPRALAFQITESASQREPVTPRSRFRCLFEGVDPDAPADGRISQLHLCNLQDAGSLAGAIGTPCVAGTRRNLLAGASARYADSRSAFRVRDTVFAVTDRSSADIHFCLSSHEAATCAREQRGSGLRGLLVSFHAGPRN
jgi:hypothetical protein